MRLIGHNPVRMRTYSGPMAILAIRITGDPVLHRPARPISDFGPDLARLARDMRETMLAAPGVGLAGPQVGEDARIFVWHWTDAATGVTHEGTVVNPALELAPLEPGAPDPAAESEGCLSVPGHKFPLRRSPRAILTGQDVTGAPLRVEARGWLARIFQHEFDHLDGSLYVDRLAEPWAARARAVVEEAGWGVPGFSWTPTAPGA